MIVIKMYALHFEDFFIMDGVVLSDSILTVHASCLLVEHSTTLITCTQTMLLAKQVLVWWHPCLCLCFSSAQKLKKIDWKWIATYVLWSTLPTSA